jgi:hypothetical protein
VAKASPTTALVAKAVERKVEVAAASTTKNPVTAGSLRAEELKPQKPVFHRYHRVSPKQLEVISNRFPQFEFRFGEGPAHDHPLGATERAVCEILALQEIERQFGQVQITDIGGNPERHALNKRTNVHSCTPVLTSDDVIRRFKSRNTNVCCKNSLDCDFPVDVYLSVHSLYYLTPSQVLELVHKSRNGALFAVVHRFDQLYGTMHDNGDFVESSYETFCEGEDVKVRMQVTGNFTTYAHDPCLWLNDTYFSNGSQAIAWNGRAIGDSWLLQFVKVPTCKIGNISVDTKAEMSLVSSLGRNDHYGSVQGVLSHGDESKYKPMLQLMKLDGCRIRSFLGHLYLHREKRVILLPKAIIQQVAVKMVGCPRDKAGLKLCINTMRNLVSSSKISMPNDMRLNCITYGSAMAFILTLEDEISAFNSVCTSYNMGLFARLFRIMNLDHWSTSICCGGEAETLLTPATRRTGTRFCGLLPSTDVAGDFALTKEMYDRDRSSVPSGKAFDATKAWPLGLPGYESKSELKPVRKGATLSHVNRDEIEDKPQFHAVAMTLQNYIPLVPYSSVNNESVAIANRALMEVPTPKQEAWDRVFATSEQFVEQFEVVDNHNIDGDFEEWNARYPASRAALQAIAYESLKIEPLNAQDLMRKAMNKRELTMKGGEVAEDFDPRAIQGGTDRLNAAYGPFCHKVSDQLRKIFGAHKGLSGAKIIYTGGMTGEEIGEVRAFFGDEDVTVIWCDNHRYDCHEGEQCTEAWRKVESKCGIREYDQAQAAAKSMEKVFGYTRHGVKYSVNHTMTSGSHCTSSRNSFINATTTYDYLWSLGYREFVLLVNGDDNIIILRGHKTVDWQNKFKQDIKRHYLELGFEIKCDMSHHWSDVEYCSSLFWPVEGGYVLGPKVGKRMPKIGFSLKKLMPGEVKGMLLGCSIECGYIPVLRNFVKHQLKLMHGVSKTEFVDDRKIYKSLPTTKHKPNDSTFQFFYDRYGITVDEAETALKTVMTKNLTDCIDFPEYEAFRERDL